MGFCSLGAIFVQSKGGRSITSSTYTENRTVVDPDALRTRPGIRFVSEPPEGAGAGDEKRETRNSPARRTGERLDWDRGPRLARARWDQRIHPPADPADRAANRLYPEPGSARVVRFQGRRPHWSVHT